MIAFTNKTFAKNKSYNLRLCQTLDHFFNQCAYAIENILSRVLTLQNVLSFTLPSESVFNTKSQINSIHVCIKVFITQMSTYFAYMKLRSKLSCYDQKIISAERVCQLHCWGAYKHSILCILCDFMTCLSKVSKQNKYVQSRDRIAQWENVCFVIQPSKVNSGRRKN